MNAPNTKMIIFKSVCFKKNILLLSYFLQFYRKSDYIQFKQFQNNLKTEIFNQIQKGRLKMRQILHKKIVLKNLI